MTIDIQDLTKTIVGSLTGLVEGDITDYVDFAEKQTKALAKQAAWIASTAVVPFGTEGGFDDREELDWFLENLEKMSSNFVKTIIALTIITLEKAWNAIVGAIWSAINGVVQPVLGVALPVPGARI
tara:strand:+ start:11293 stop:11670 length:378 start_codon:yes stop_codon:yes gene_type:complete